jgi:serine protease Do
MSIQREDIAMIQNVERYLEGKMLPNEIAYFEQLRKNIPEIDEMVVEHNMLMHHLDNYSNRLNFKNALNDVHEKLAQQGDIQETNEVSRTGRIVQLYHKYKRVTAIAASVGGIIALVISAIVSSIAPASNNNKLEQLNRVVAQIQQKQQSQGNKLNEVAKNKEENIIVNSGGTGFLINAEGYIITNAHVLHGSSGANVMSADHEIYDASIVYRDEIRDLAILKISDNDYTSLKKLPYTIKKSEMDLGEELFTLGYPRNDITYNKGDISASTGHDGDTLSYQIQMSANPGNSGGPVFNKNGEVIGIISTREKQSQGVSFAIKSKNIFRLVDDLKKGEHPVDIKLTTSSSSIKNKDRVSQIKQIENCVFLVKAFNKKLNK